MILFPTHAARGRHRGATTGRRGPSSAPRRAPRPWPRPPPLSAGSDRAAADGRAPAEPAPRGPAPALLARDRARARRLTALRWRRLPARARPGALSAAVSACDRAGLVYDVTGHVHGACHRRSRCSSLRRVAQRCVQSYRSLAAHASVLYRVSASYLDPRGVPRADPRPLLRRRPVRYRSTSPSCSASASHTRCSRRDHDPRAAHRRRRASRRSCSGWSGSRPVHYHGRFFSDFFPAALLALGIVGLVILFMLCSAPSARPSGALRRRPQARGRARARLRIGTRWTTSRCATDKSFFFGRRRARR